MKPFILAILICFSTNTLYALQVQVESLSYSSPTSLSLAPTSDLIRRRVSFFKENTIFSIGISAGEETFLGIPKMSYFKTIPIQGYNNDLLVFDPMGVYFGPEASIFIFFAGVSSFSMTGGISLGPITVDNALTYTAIAGPSSTNQSSSYTTYNPKLGLAIGPIWLKAGPVHFLSGYADWGDWFDIDGKPWNFELRYIKRLN